MRRLNIGSGHVRLPGYERLDVDQEARPDHYCRAEDVGDYFDEESFDEIRAAHVLEHIRPSDLFGTLRGIWKALKPNGILEVVVPDVGAATHDWCAGMIDDDKLVKTILGGDPDATEWMVHRNIFWTDRLGRWLTITGFVRLEVEDASTYELKMTCRRPGE